MDKITEAEKRQLLGDNIVEWRCPSCEAVAYTHKSQGALMVKCKNCPSLCAPPSGEE